MLYTLTSYRSGGGREGGGEKGMKGEGREEGKKEREGRRTLHSPLAT